MDRRFPNNNNKKSLSDSIRDRINEWLNPNQVNDRIEMVFNEELEEAIENVRPEIKNICQESVKKLFDQFSANDLIFNKDIIKDKLNEQLIEAMDYWSDEIKETLYELLDAELKESKIKIN